MDFQSVTQEQRLAERRERVHKKLAALRGLPSDAAAVGSPAIGNSRGEARAQQALETAAEVRSEAYHAVTQFRVKADAEEYERRDRNHALAEANVKKRALEEGELQTKEGSIQMTFEALYDFNVPHQLHSALESQKKDCAHVIDIKDRLIHELRTQLEEKEKEYVSLLKRNEQEITQLVETMHMKTEEFVNHYTEELEAVEKAYMTERSELIQQYAEEIQQLVKTRRVKEADYRKRRETKLTDAQVALDSKHDSSYEEYNAIKRELQKDIYALREEQEKCKADFMLNGERLSYNLQVLRERVTENKSAQSQYKRKLATLQDTLSTLVSRHQESEKRFQRANKALTVQLHRVDAQYKDLQHKFQFFEQADTKKYRQIREMHDAKSKELVHKSLQADRVVFEEILGMPWQPPEMTFWTEEVEDSDPLDRDNDEQEFQPLELSEPALMLFHILQSQAPFLVDDNVRAAIKKIEGTTDDQAAVEGILTTLRLQRTEDIRDMMEYFVVETGEEMQALINPQEAIRALNAYLSERKETASNSKAPSSKEVSDRRAKAAARKKERRSAAERSYWTRISEVIPQDHLHVWEALEKGMEQYLAQLQQRRHLIAATDTLRSQNDELRGLLGQYLESSINYELYVPPKLVMQAQRSTQ